MHITYGTNPKAFCYQFSNLELSLLIAALKQNDRTLQQKQTRIYNSPKNNGNVIWLEKQKHIEYEIMANAELINEFTSELNNRLK